VNITFGRISRLIEHIFPKGATQSGWMAVAAGGKIVLVSGLLISGLVTGLKYLRLLEPAELFIFDSLVRARPDRELDSRLTIVGITEEDIQQYGWPLTDKLLADLLAELQIHQPDTIGLDLYRSTFRNPGTEALIEQLAADNLVAIMNVGDSPTQGEVPPPPTVELGRIGFNDFPTDSDGIIRRNLLFVGTSQRDYYSLGLRVVMLHKGYADDALTRDGNSLYLDGIPLRALSSKDGGYQDVDDSGYQILLRYHSREFPAKQISISQVLSGQFDPSQIEGKLVMVGTTAASLKDRFYTPFSSNQDDEVTMPGVVIHAQMVSQLLDIVEGRQALYRFLPVWAEWFWLWGWCLVAGSIAWSIKHPLGLFTTISLSVISLVGVGWLAIGQLLWLPLAEPVVGILATAGMVTAYKLLYRSTHDPLTGLPNREAFMGILQKALQNSQDQASQHPVIVVFMDIDRFKVINESLGHQAGDQVLSMLSNRLTHHLPPEARAARVGGDEFALILTGVNREQAGEMMDKLQYALSQPMMLNGQKLPSTISMGMAVTQTGLEHKPADLLRDAHTAMYRAKALGKSRFEIFSDGMLAEAVNRLQLESDLISALDNEEFLLYYQPIIRLQTGEIAGFEALVRWQQKDRGFVLPSTFIPAAEETGLIMPLGQWIFREACRQLHTWHNMFPDYSGLTMSINLSNRQFSQTDLVRQIQSVIEETGVKGDSIRLEITESMVMGDVDAAIDLMLRLKSLDLKLGIDDFGTGYSSLSYLHRFPMDTLKVDKSFVGRLEDSDEDRAIIHTILTLGQKLGMEVVAEGVETLEQINLLKAEGCDYGQGYYFAKPLPSEAAQELLSQHRSLISVSH
jgi:diguanylate cyclase (GGDEF)-like protein